jgi:hypothetical protein
MRIKRENDEKSSEKARSRVRMRIREAELN